MSAARLPSMASLTPAPFSQRARNQSNCPLFKLPQELRDQIYELVYTAETKDDGTIMLNATKPPTKDLGLTCQRLHVESYGLFKTAYRQYWDHEFSIDLVNGQNPAKWMKRLGLANDQNSAWWMETLDLCKICNVSDVDLLHVTRIQVIFETVVWSQISNRIAVTKIKKVGSAWQMKTEVNASDHYSLRNEIWRRTTAGSGYFICMHSFDRERLEEFVSFLWMFIF